MQTTISTFNDIETKRRRENIQTLTTPTSPANLRLMKKKISIAIVLMIMLLPTAFSQRSQPVAVKKISLESFSKININNGITVILIDDENEDSASIEGTEQFVEKVVLRQFGNELELKTKGLKNLNNKGVIYIPVRSFIQIVINADANLVSFSTLNLPVLDILVNGNCTVNLATKGKLNIRETEGFSFVYRQRLPANEATIIK